MQYYLHNFLLDFCDGNTWKEFYENIKKIICRSTGNLQRIYVIIPLLLCVWEIMLIGPDKAQLSGFS